jgi:hypothetical protein
LRGRAIPATSGREGGGARGERVVREGDVCRGARRGLDSVSVAVVAPPRDPNARQGAASPVRIQGIFVNFGDGSRAGRPELRDARTSHRVGVLIPFGMHPTS